MECCYLFSKNMKKTNPDRDGKFRASDFVFFDSFESELFISIDFYGKNL